MSFSFSQLSLSGVQAAAGVVVLPPGRYVCKVKDAEVADTKAGDGKVLKVKLVSEGNGVITDNINIYNPSAKAMEIGLEQLKGLLVSGGHPDPDNIGQHGVASIRGLTVGVYVGEEMYNGKSSSRVKGYMKPEDVPANGNVKASAAPAAAIGKGGMPF